MKLFDKANDALKLVQDSLNALLSRRTELLERIEEKNAKIKALRDMPMSLDDFCSFIPHFVKDSGNKAYPALYSFNREANQMPWSHPENEDGEINPGHFFIRNVGGAESGNTGINFFNKMCFFFPDVVSQRLIEALKAEDGGQWGNESFPAVAERRQQVATLRDERTAIEKELEDVNGEIARISTVVDAIPKEPQPVQEPELGAFMQQNGMVLTVEADSNGRKSASIS
ncbi:hypothetical protein NZL45_001959 [Escherichia coli]|uniref:hypothetical protein n=1 Tax=Escherichia coli TaxID=562 RepID=UPI00025CA8E9|nr:hypothetical protein [Escherichia coli]EFA8282750.1 hypothetical protein [Escherichia coli O157]EEW4293828.1 hypothetical protein [Escherichia coli]EEZ5825758.1 hypothetical protein [Escherichia coli]EFG4662339.1 hypothetical protein [Escherichia coli]EFH7026436.1 hypothetical protein [Escherichia coli]